MADMFNTLAVLDEPGVSSYVTSYAETSVSSINIIEPDRVITINSNTDNIATRNITADWKLKIYNIPKTNNPADGYVNITTTPSNVSSIPDSKKYYRVRDIFAVNRESQNINTIILPDELYDVIRKWNNGYGNNKDPRAVISLINSANPAQYDEWQRVSTLNVSDATLIYNRVGLSALGEFRLGETNFDEYVEYLSDIYKSSVELDDALAKSHAIHNRPYTRTYPVPTPTNTPFVNPITTQPAPSANTPFVNPIPTATPVAPLPSIDIDIPDSEYFMGAPLPVTTNDSLILAQYIEQELILEIENAFGKNTYMKRFLPRIARALARAIKKYLNLNVKTVTLGLQTNLTQLNFRSDGTNSYLEPNPHGHSIDPHAHNINAP